MDVIVIGCGASGLAAMSKLHEAGLKVMGLEAADRIGGRILTVPFGSAKVDIGAAWCHGEEGNVVFQLANPLGLIGRPQGDMDQISVLSNGDVVKDAKTITNELNKIVDEADKMTDKSIAETLRNGAKTNAILSKDPKLTNSFLEWYERNTHVSPQIDPKKKKSLRSLIELQNCSGEVWLHWKGKGYTTILDVLMKKYPDPTKELPLEILLNKEVESIKWSASQGDHVNPLVQVTCKDGSLYAARSVLVTVSIGVLKDRHTKLFNPPLPAQKITAINTYQMAVLGKIYVEFKTFWWRGPVNFSLIWRDEDKALFSKDEQWLTEIYGFQYVESQPNVLLAWMCGEGAKAMEKVDEAAVKAGIQKLVKVVFKKFDVAEVKNVLRTKWGSDRLTQGAYAYRSVLTEQDGGSAAILSEPLYYNNVPVVCFAGEATSLHRHTQVHGAIESGFREADRLIESLKAK